MTPNDRAKCAWCGKTYVEHAYELEPGAPVPKMPCKGLREYFHEAGSVVESSQLSLLPGGR